MVLGLSLLSYAANLFIFHGAADHRRAPIVSPEAAGYADPLPQALVLTAIVISFGMTGFIMALSVRTCIRRGAIMWTALSRLRSQAGGPP